jgi:hypothetical protein
MKATFLLMQRECSLDGASSPPPVSDEELAEMMRLGDVTEAYIDRYRIQTCRMRRRGQSSGL